MEVRKDNKQYKIKENSAAASGLGGVPPVMSLSENSSSFLTMEEDMIPKEENADFDINIKTENSSEIDVEEYRIQTMSIDYDNVDSPLNSSEPKPKRTYVRKKKGRKIYKYQVKGCYKCRFCDKTYSWFYSLERHESQHTQKQIFECEHCARIFPIRNYLTNHMKAHRKDIELGKSVPIIQYYQKYLYSQEALPTVNVCKLCNEKFTTISLLRRHLKGHSNENSFKDEEIGKLQKLLKLESKSLDEFKVMVKSNISQSDFSQYYEIVNRFSLELPLSDSGIDDTDEGLPQTKYKCELCNQEYLYDYEINEHTLQEHSACKKPYKCDICELEFVCYKMFFIHEQSQCRNENKKYKCEYCPARFMWFGNLENHKPICRTNISEALKLYGKSKVKSADKDNESSSSTIDKAQESNQRFQCQYCDEWFTVSADLLRHRLTHFSTTRKYQCHVCERKFKSMNSLQVHLKTKNCSNINDSIITSNSNKILIFGAIPEDMCKPHGRKTMKCKICNSEYEKSSDLKAHLLSHQFILTFDGNAKSFEDICRRCYPEEPKIVKEFDEAALISRIKNEIANHQLERFYSISNEFGYELGISSSETDDDDDDEDSDNYLCELCGSCFNRKYKAFHHQNIEHRKETRPHSCTNCDWKFINRKLLDWHLRKQCKNKKKQFLCEKCNVRFMWKDNFEHHMQVSHNENPDNDIRFSANEVTTSIKCPLCPCDFDKEQSLETHIKMHDIDIKDLPLAKVLFQATIHSNGRKKIICKNCDTQFKTITGLREHFKDTSTCGKTSGNTINYSITNEHGFELDINDSDSEVDEKSEDAGINKTKQYTCVLCSISFRRKFEIARHQHSTHKYELLPLKCNKCIFKTMSLNILDYHKRTQCDNHKKLHQCDECNFKFMWLENLEKHKEFLHGKAQASDVPRVFECGFCPRQYNLKHRLIEHIKRRHPKMAENFPRRKVAENQALVCSVCDKVVHSAFYLKIHMRRHTGEKPFKCDLCDKSYSCFGDLEAHYRIHTEAKLNTCSICNKTCTNVYSLIKHQLVHAEEKPYKCDFGDCKKTFTTNGGLVSHMRKHTGERPFKCNFDGCRKSFAGRGGLSYHMLTHTGEKPYACGICDEKFRTQAALKNHRSKNKHYEQ